jgi:hypothetical protein
VTASSAVASRPQFDFTHDPQLPVATRNWIAGVEYPSEVKNDVPTGRELVSAPTASRPESPGGNWIQEWMLGPVIAPPGTAIECEMY